MHPPVIESFRPRRLRRSIGIRNLVQETHLFSSSFIAPLFIMEGENSQVPISSMPDVFRMTIDKALDEISTLIELGIRSVLLFTYNTENKKDPQGSYAYEENNFLHKVISSIKTAFPDLVVFVDIALDPFTDHGHDGIVNASGTVLNDETVIALSKMSLLAAKAGADFVAPSDMMDGRVRYIRKILDTHGYTDVGIMSYAAKYASSFYGPFRDALDSSPKFGDKKSYQLNPANAEEALIEAFLDEEEGADLLLIKPALTNLDVLYRVSQTSRIPVGAYQVSGEWSMLQAAGQRGWLDQEKTLLETLLSIKRAGARFIITYGAKQAALLLKKG